MSSPPSASSSLHERSCPEERCAPRAVWLLCLAAFGGLALLFGYVGGQSAQLQRPDFEYFYKGGRSLLKHGSLDPGYDVGPDGKVVVRGSMEWYLPFPARLMTLLAWLPLREANFLWLGLNLVALFVTIRLVGRTLSGLPPGDWPVTQLVPVVLLILCWGWEFKLNQINNFTLLLMVGSFACWRRGAPLAGGLWLGLAVLIKLTPALLVVWFALKRQWRVVGAASLTIVLAGPVGDVAVFGPAGAQEAYRDWAHNALERGGTRHVIVSGVETDWRNQSLGAVAVRWLHPVNYTTRFDNEPRIAPFEGERFVNVVAWPREVIAWIVLGIQALSAAVLLWLARIPADRLTVWQLRLEWSLFALGMLWFMPVMRGYHVIWAYPAVAVLGGAMHHYGWRQRTWTAVAIAALAVVVVAQTFGAVFELETARRLDWHARGIFLLVVVAIAVPAIGLLVRLRRGPEILPAAPAAPGTETSNSRAATSGKRA